MSARNEHSKEHISDQLALVGHIHEAVQRQTQDEHVRAHPEFNRVIMEIERTMKQHQMALETLAGQYEAARGGLKMAITEVLGVAAGLYDKIRNYTVSRMLRDDYTALSLCAMGYTTFHTYGLGIGDQRIAQLALSHLKDITPLLVEISRLLPVAVAEEMMKEGDRSWNQMAGQEAVRNTQEAWSGSWINTHQV